jgi:5-methylcytosine-specific restriction endonuclease McrA
MQYQGRFERVSDDELLRRLSSLLGESRRVEADLVDHIAEVDERRLYAREALPSMFAYCTEVLRLSEAEAGLRITVARIARAHPTILEMLADGRLHLSGIVRLGPRLTPENADALLKRAAHRTKSQIEELVAELAPRPDVPAVIRKLPAAAASAPGIAPPATAPPATALPAAAPSLFVSGGQHRPDGVASTVASAPAIQPLAPERYKVQFTAGAELRRKLERLQKLMSADLAEVIERAVSEKLERLESKRFALTNSPRKSLTKESSTTTRYIPAALKRAVYVRDDGRCRYTDSEGRRCPERDRLEYHHRFPYVLGGQHMLRDVCLMCRTHNQYEAEHDFGRAVMARHRSARIGRNRGSA